ncbi:MAG: myxalamid-type nonribosomal peptide synthetase MxaA, partial [Pseudohongiellaceae bacterium]
HAEQASLPIGRPLPGTQAHVVDEQLRLLPMGLIGELCLAGPSLANGYIYDGATTAAAFVPNPFDDGVHARLYRTGDLVRRQVDGSLVFVGRADTQVKVAGQRMELNEIEALLASHPLVNQCAVSTAGQTPASLRLIAWVAIGDEQAPLDGLSTPASRPSSTHASSLRQWLAERLPQAMVPRTFELLPTLPRTSTGKIDRPALQARLNSQQEATVSSSPLVSTRDSPQPADEHAAALLRAEISALFERLLGPGAAAPDADFFASGGHSLLAIELAEHLSSLTGQTVPVQTVFERRTAAALANVLHRRSLGQDAPLLEEIDLFAEVQLDSCVQPGQRRAAQPAAEVLLTGATGFLGAHLLIDLLQHTEARVHCLVRAADATLAAQRITRNLRSYELAVSPDQSARIVALPGDLAAEHLGLDTVSYEGLASSLDLVLHNGAAVDFLQGYRALEGTNVQGTKSVLQLCARAGAAVHFVSTLGVLTSPNLAQRQSLNEDLPMADLVDVEGGYEQTKWVAEMLVHEAGSRGLPVAIYRPGRIAGNSRTGCWAADDVARRFMVGTAHLGSWPELDAPIDLSPVDWVSGSIVHLALAGAAHGETYHLVHPQPSPIELFASAAERLGYTFDRVSPDEWQRRAISAAEHDNAHPLHLMLPLLPKIEGRPITADELVPEATMPPIGSDFTQRALRNASTCPTVDLALVERWLTKMLPPHQSTTTESSL